MKKFKRAFIACAFVLLFLYGCSHRLFHQHTQLTKNIKQYEKGEFRIDVNEAFSNPYDAREITLDMVLKSPSGDSVFLPCFFVEKDGPASVWMARFAPRESGTYTYYFQLVKNGNDVNNSTEGTFTALPSMDDGFLHTHDMWTLKFDSGKPFRGIGENIGWESRSFADPRWNYDYLLPTLSQNGANFFRSWMSPNNFPLEWKRVKDTKRYTDTDAYFNPAGIKRLDEVVELADSLGLYMMLTFDSHNALMEDNQWEINNYNIKNGGPASTPEEFFTLKESREKYKNRLRYIVARWGYSTHIAAWEFFNEIDNAAYVGEDSLVISHEAITSWHQEMAAYLKDIDPYGHIVTTSVSHRKIKGLYSVDELDLNQMHIYKRTGKIPAGIHQYTKEYNKPFCWGEFGYEWDWNKDFEVIGEEMDFDYKRGLWYGLFSPTPVLPMSWWWEFFDERGMTAYIRNVSMINEKMLDAGKGSFENFKVNAPALQGFGVKCGDSYFVYLLNNSDIDQVSDVLLDEDFPDLSYDVQSFFPGDDNFYVVDEHVKALDGIAVPDVKVSAGHEIILIVTPQVSLPGME